jgi:hypothetical protein
MAPLNQFELAGLATSCVSVVGICIQNQWL